MLTIVAMPKLKQEKKLYSRMVRSTRVSGEAIKNMATGFKNGPTELGMKVCGLIVRLAGRESFGTLTEIFLKESGMMIKRMGSDFINTLTEQVTQVIGKKIYSMVRAKSIGSTGASISETTKWAKKMVKASIGGRTAVLTMAHGWTTK